jgi:hypothetical protein
MTRYAYTKSKKMEWTFALCTFLNEWNSRQQKEGDAIMTEGLARYDLGMDGTVLSKLSLNAHNGECDVDREVNPELVPQLDSEEDVQE